MVAVTEKQEPEPAKMGDPRVVMALEPHLYEAKPEVVPLSEPLTAHTDS